MAADDQVDGAGGQAGGQLHVAGPFHHRAARSQAEPQVADDDQHVAQRPERRDEVLRGRDRVGDAAAARFGMDLRRGGQADDADSRALGDEDRGGIAALGKLRAAGHVRRQDGEGRVAGNRVRQQWAAQVEVVIAERAEIHPGLGIEAIAGVNGRAGGIMF